MILDPCLMVIFDQIPPCLVLLVVSFGAKLYHRLNDDEQGTMHTCEERLGSTMWL